MPFQMKHIAIIMDGNRRWAQENGLEESQGYAKGVLSVEKIVRSCIEQQISYLTLFAFSTENWKRSQKEVEFLFSLIGHSLLKYESLIVSQKIRLQTIGDLSALPETLQKKFTSVCEQTKQNNKFHLILAINYGGRKEILSAVKKISRQSKDVANFQEKDFEECLQTSRFPPPDLIIRTGGVKRLSNFYLWSSAYSELYFTDVMWPDFNDQELRKAIEYYKGIDRRFGGA